jgi:hypothetical protein
MYCIFIVYIQYLKGLLYKNQNRRTSIKKWRKAGLILRADKLLLNMIKNEFIVWFYFSLN